MTDKRLTPAVAEWLLDTDAPTPDLDGSVERAMSNVEQTPQLRRRWWLPAVGRIRASAPTAEETNDYRPRPIPATNGHSATVAGRTQSMFSPAKAITAGALVLAIGGALLIAQPFDQGGSSAPGAAVDEDAMRPALVTGTITYDEDSGEFTCLSGPWGSCVDSPSADGVTRFRTLGQTATVEMSDPRLSGDATVDEYGDVFDSETRTKVELGEGYGFEWGTMRIVNEAGAWEGSWIASSTIAETETEDAVSPILLVGSGAYDGLSAILYEVNADWGDGPNGPDSLDGTIFPGDPPPDRE